MCCTRGAISSAVFSPARSCVRAIPFRRFLIREAHNVSACHKFGVTPALVMRRMTAVSPYRHWHFFDAYPPGYLRAVYRGNGIPLPWGNMSLVSDPCPRWAVFRLLQTPDTPSVQKPKSQISVMQDGKRARLYCCHSLLTRDALDELHVLSVGVDLLPALEAQGFDGEAIVGVVAESCRRGGGDGAIPASAAAAIRAASQVLNISWIADALGLQRQRHLPAQRRVPAAPAGVRLKRCQSHMVQGRWKITIATPMGDKSGVLELRVDGNMVTGSLSDGEHRVDISDGKIEGNRVSWSRQDHQAHALEFQVHGRGRGRSHQRCRPPYAGQRALHRHANVVTRSARIAPCAVCRPACCPDHRRTEEITGPFAL